MVIISSLFYHINTTTVCHVHIVELELQSYYYYIRDRFTA